MFVVEIIVFIQRTDSRWRFSLFAFLFSSHTISCRPAQTAHRGPSAKQESQTDGANPTSAPANASGPSGLKSKSSGKPDNSDGEDWGREQEEEEEEEEEDDDDDADEDYEAPGSHSTTTGGSSHPSAPTEWTCPQCQNTFTDNEDYLSHVKMEHGKV